MQLRTALRLNPSDVVAFVGGGGKTTAMFRLAAEIVAAGGRVVTTTTTRIFAAQVKLAPAHFVAGEASPAEIEAGLERHGHVLVTGSVEAESGKSFGIDLETLAELRALPGAPTVLIEADGSRMRPFKAPAAHEPVIPLETTVLVPVVGANVFGAPLAAERVHRPELVGALASAPLGAPVTPEMVTAVLAHPQGGLKGRPPGARALALINKVEAPGALQPARQLAARLLAGPAFEAVLLGTVRGDDAVREAWGRVAAVVLAAGRSTRMGRTKQLLPWGRGGTLLGEVVRRLQASGLTEVVVVTGQDRDAVEASLAGLAVSGIRVRCVHNPDYATTEMARSLQVGLGALPANYSAALVALGDQPHLEPDVVGRLVQRWRETLAPVVVPHYRGQRGHPLLFDRAAWPGLLGLPPEANPRAFLKQAPQLEAVEVDSDAILRDVDTPEDYAAQQPPGSGQTGII